MSIDDRGGAIHRFEWGDRGQGRILAECETRFHPRPIFGKDRHLRRSCEPMPAITTTSEHTGHWTKARRPFVPFSGSATSRHTRSSAELIITTSGFKFSVHTSLGFWDRGSQNRGKERQLVDARGQPGDELFQAVVQ
jgi:hypothetical protein